MKNTWIHTKAGNLSNKGITIVALSVTIVVMLILAGVTVATLSGDNGVIKRAKEETNKVEERKASVSNIVNSLEMQLAETVNETASGSANPEDVIAGKTYWKTDSLFQTGTMPNNQ